MPKAKQAAAEDEPRYRIGAVCRLTGLSQHVLRVWEKRYGVVNPERGENRRRLYRESDVNRLSLLKALVDRGQAIGSIAALDSAELERRLQQSAPMQPRPADAEKPRLALVGDTLAIAREACAGSDIFELTGIFADIDNLATRDQGRRLDVVVIEWPTLHPDSSVEATRLANRINARHLVLVYDYAPRAALERLASDRMTALRSPLDLAALEAVVAWRFGFIGHTQTSPEDIAGIAPRRHFNDRELSYLAEQSNAIACECPMHLAQLITALVRFEAYSAECESRNSEDARLHAYLHRTTSLARSTMERALVRVVEFENLSLLPDS